MTTPTPAVGLNELLGNRLLATHCPNNAYANK
jgi:hypothetical protein